VNYTLPKLTTVYNFRRLLDGVDACTAAHRTTVVGGDLRDGDTIELSATAVGQCMAGGQAGAYRRVDWGSAAGRFAGLSVGIGVACQWPGDAVRMFRTACTPPCARYVSSTGSARRWTRTFNSTRRWPASVSNPG
jgi:thiamine-monophosphate kinase